MANEFENDSDLRALTVRQPWASLIMQGRKTIETRSAATHRRGRVMIHAAQTMSNADKAFARSLGIDPDALPRGVIIGSVEIIDSKTTDALAPTLSEDERRLGNYRVPQFGWVLARPIALATPVAAKGALSFWRVSRDARDQLTLACGNGHDVFVYGTLKRGQGNHGLLTRGAVFVDVDSVSGALYDMGFYPAARVDVTADVVHGEVYRVTEETLQRLDSLEGVPVLYRRERVLTRAGRSVWIYVMSAAQLKRAEGRIMSGVWARGVRA